MTSIRRHCLNKIREVFNNYDFSISVEEKNQFIGSSDDAVRIEKLISEAEKNVNWFAIGKNLDRHEWTKLCLENLSDLIIAECVTCCERTIEDHIPSSVDEWLHGGVTCIENIKSHFGIEE
jgi:hypothetical protein